jgi:large subunit ribosomal protein L7/L12
MADVKKLAEELVNLTVKEVNELATILKEEYGIEPAAAAVAVAAPAAAAGAESRMARHHGRAVRRVVQDVSRLRA